MHKPTKQKQGFTLIELLLVVVIIGILLAVIVPRAWRANVDAKYGLVRQNATELASFASQWAEQMMEAQDLDSDSRLSSYYMSLTMPNASASAPVAPSDAVDAQGGQWIARATSNWNNAPGTSRQPVAGRNIGDAPKTDPETSIEDLIPPERLPRNPFSGANVFRDLPDSTTVIPGALAAGYAGDAGVATYFAIVFQGTDNEPAAIAMGWGDNSDLFHAGMGTDLPGLRNGIFMARIMRQ